MQVYDSFKRLLPGWFKHGLKTQWHRLRWRGDRVQCPCCGSSFAAFMQKDTWDDGTPRMMCPVCGSRERHRWSVLYAERATTLFNQPQNLLHFSPQEGVARRLRRIEHLHYVGSNIAADRNAHLRMDITRIAFPDNSFDTIFCSHVLEHVPDDAAALCELYRVLKPGGWALLNIPYSDKLATTFEDWRVTTPEERKRVFGQHDHVRNIGRDYVDRMRAAGFQIEMRKAREGFTEAELQRHAIIPQETMFIARKPGT